MEQSEMGGVYKTGHNKEPKSMLTQPNRSCRLEGGWNIYRSLKLSPHKVLTTLKEANSNLVVERWTPFIKWPKANVTCNVTRGTRLPPDTMQWGHCITSEIVLPKTHNLNPMKKHPNNPHRRTVCKITAPTSSKLRENNVNSRKKM